MNTRKFSRTNISKDDSSYASTSSSSRISCDFSETLTDDEASSSDDYEENDDLDKLLHKLECLKGVYFEKKLEKAVLKRCNEVENVSKFMNNLFSKKEHKDSRSEEQKETIAELYRKNRDLSKRLKVVSKQNKNTTKEIFQLYIRLEGLMEERKMIWNEAVKIHKLNLGDSSVFVNSDYLQQLNDSTFKQKDIIRLDYYSFIKSFFIVRLARVFYNLISNSEESWATDKNLMEILECTSKILDRDFDVKNHKTFIKTIDEVIFRLNNVKI